jgi:hypothetical protein
MVGRVTFRFLVLGCGLMALSACAVSPTQTADAPQAIPVTAQALVGSTPEVLDADFGVPALRRVDGTAQVWLYHSTVCGLNVFLYPDANGTPRVAAAVPDNGDPASCMQSLTHGVTAAGLERPASS